MKLPRASLFLSTVAGIAFILIAAGAWLLPRLVDSQLIHDKISAQFATKSQGRLSFKKLEILWFPRPRAVFENVAIALNEETRGTVRSVEIYPSIFELLLGRWVVREAMLNNAQFHTRIPPRSAESFVLDEKQIRAALIALAKQLPASRMALSEGSVEVAIGDQAPLILENVQAQIVDSSSELVIELNTKSNLWERVNIIGRTSAQNLALQLDLDVRRFKIKEALQLLGSPLVDHLQAGETSFKVKMASGGAGQLQASIDGSVGPLVLAGQGSSANIEAKKIKGTITYQDGNVQADIGELDFAAPRLRASVKISAHTNSCATDIRLRDGDIAQLRDLVQRLAGDRESIRTLLRHVLAGTLSDMNLHSSAPLCGELATNKNLNFTATIRNAQIAVPNPDLEFTNVSGAIRFADATLEGKNITAALGSAKGWNGQLRMGPQGATTPFHLDIEVQSGAAELRAVLLKMISDDFFHKEILKLQRVEGELTGRVILGETLAAISPTVAMSKVNISATHSAVPFPINISGARFNLAPSVIRLERADGSLGNSNFAGLGLTWHRGGTRELRIDAGRVSLDLQQIDTWLRGFKDLHSYLSKVRSVGGRIDFQQLTLSGAYDQPATWVVTSTGSLNQLAIVHADLPDRLVVSSGKFAVNHGQISYSESAASMSDAAFVLDGQIEYKQGRLLQIDSSGKGKIGPHMTQWLSRYMDLREDVKLHSPLIIDAGKLAWRDGANTTFVGRMSVANGPQLSIDLTNGPQEFALPNLTIDDGGRHAQLTLQRAKERLEMSFAGELTAQTLDKIFTSLPVKGASVSGEMKISASLASAGRFSASGQLSGSHLPVTLGGQQIALEKFDVESNDDQVLIRSADLRWQDTRLNITGKVGVAGEAWQLDLNVSGDRLSLEELERLFDAREDQNNKTTRTRIEGLVKLKLNSFSAEHLTLSALQVKTELSSSSIKAEIERATVCGIDTTGQVDVEGSDVRIDFRFAAKDADLGPTTVCLTSQANETKGTYTLTARLSGRGDRTQLRSSLKGDFNFSARDGAFVRAAAVDEAFDYLNHSGDFDISFPDLDKQAFSFQTLSAKGTISGEKIFHDEIVIRASPLTITVQGGLDLESRQVDFKGLVSVALPAHQVLKRIPIVGTLVGGSLVGIPLRMRGSLEHPEISYLSLADVGGELINLPMRILGMPLDAIKVFVPGNQN
jgi:hypothetical protein